MITEYFSCACMSNNHTIRFLIDHDDDVSMMYVDVKLNKYLPWYKRLWYGMRYIFGSKTCNGCEYDSWLLDEKDIFRMRDMCDEFIKVKEWDK